MESLFGINLSELGQQAMDAAATTILAPLDRGSGFYWPFLLSSLVIAVFVYAITRRPGAFSLAGLLRAGLDRRIWAAESAKADYRYYIVNNILSAILLLPLIATSAAAGLLLSESLAAVFGPIETPLFGPVSLKVACTVAFFVGYDFGHFVSHYVQHRVPLLWEFHKVHHSAEVLTPMTATRLHPVDFFLMTFGRNVGAGLGIGVVFYLGAGEVTMYTIFGMTVLSAAYQMIGHLRHTMLWVTYGPLNGILVSPAHHQIHHSALLEHRNKNNGFAFTLWDRVFGTYYAPGKQMNFPMGIGDGSDGAWHRVGRMYWWPVVNVARLLRGRAAIGTESVTLAACERTPTKSEVLPSEIPA
jgi:sterol desaturase/sphingolipid hydroxylase (fatty acid hydroxylase superfamily)